MINVPTNPLFVGLDLETAPLPGFPAPFALQPWRVFERAANVTSISIVDATGSGSLITDPTAEAVSASVAAHTAPENIFTAYNSVFDLAWMLAIGMDLTGFVMFDAMLLWKHHSNSQRAERRPNWGLAAAAKRWIPDLDWTADFIDMKKVEHTAGDDNAYWESRAQLDAYATAVIAERIWAALSDQQRRLAYIEALCLVPMAQSWLDGIYLDMDEAMTRTPVITDEMKAIEEKLGLVTPPTTCKKDVEATINGWIPSKILSSPKKLSKLLYEDWGLQCSRFSDKTGDPSSDKVALTYLTDTDSRVLDIMRWRQLNTQLGKFILGLIKTCNYLQSKLAHPCPRPFSTYTGRVTYSTRSGQKGDYYKAKVGIPLHQMPRPKEIRSLIPAFIADISINNGGNHVRV